MFDDQIGIESRQLFALYTEDMNTLQRGLCSHRTLSTAKQSTESHSLTDTAEQKNEMPLFAPWLWPFRLPQARGHLQPSFAG